MYSLLTLALASFTLSFLLTPLIRNLALRFALLDRPDHLRKLHTAPVPRIGGLPIALAYLAALGILLLSPLQGDTIVEQSLPLIWKLLPAAVLVFATGLFDDLIGLKPWQKLLGQLAAASLAYWAGVQIHGFASYSITGWLAFPITLLWLIGCTNAINLIDGVDGLAVGVGLFATITTLVAALLQGNMTLALATAPLAGALVGFLRYNFNPASIFLGDSGSLWLGFLLGCYAVIWSQKSATLLGMTAPLIALSIPLLDTALSILRRFLRGQPIFGADRSHIHHRLLDRGLTPRRAVLLLYAVCGLAAAFSLLQSTLRNQFAGLVIVLFCAAAWLGIQHLGYAELTVARRLIFRGTFHRVFNAQLQFRTLEQALTAATSVEECWQIIRDASRDSGFTHLALQLDHTVFEESLRHAEPSNSWTMRMPLSGSGLLNLTGEFEDPDRAMVAAPFAHAMRRSLQSALLRLHSNDHP
jgi:UDP-GlcNAc:undecaprenyl-phosphate GlcNAc-1-phosphate transferase